jgi:cell division protein FtsB
MTDWLKFYIGGLIADISAHKAMIEAQQAEIDRLKVDVEDKTRTISLLNLKIDEIEPPND